MDQDGAKLALDSLDRSGLARHGNRLAGARCGAGFHGLEQATADVDHAAGLDWVIEPGVGALKLVARAAPVQPQAALGATLRRPSTLRQGLPHRHAAIDAVRAGTLHFAINVEQRRAVNVDHIAGGYRDIVVILVVEKQRRDIDFLAEGLACTLTHDYGNVGPGRRNSARDGDHLGDADVESLQRKAPRAVDEPKDRDLVTAHLQRQDADLRLLDEIAVGERLGNGLLGERDRQAAYPRSADEGIRNDAVLAHPGLQREIRIVEHRDADAVARPEPVFDQLVLRPGAQRERCGEYEQRGTEQATKFH